MRVFLIVLSIIVLLLFLLTRLRLGVEIHWDGDLALNLYLGLLHFQLLPRKPSKAPKEPKTKKKPDKGKERPKLTLKDGFAAVRALKSPLLRMLRRLGRGIRINPLQVAVILGGANEPADTAQLYGQLHEAVWIVMPMAEHLLDIPAPGIHIGLDFESPQTQVQADLKLSLRLGTLLAAVLDLALPALHWLSARSKPPQGSENSPPVRTVESEP